MLVLKVKGAIKAGKHQQLREILDTVQYDYGVKEPGCEQYECFIDGDTMVMTELWEDAAALETHMGTETVQRLLPQMKDCVENGELHVQTVVAERENIQFSIV